MARLRTRPLSIAPAFLAFLGALCTPSHADTGAAIARAEAWEVGAEAAACVLRNIDRYLAVGRNPVLIRTDQCAALGNDTPDNPVTASRTESAPLKALDSAPTGSTPAAGGAADALNSAIGSGEAASGGEPVGGTDMLMAGVSELVPAVRQASDGAAWTGGQSGKVVVYTRDDLACLRTLRDGYDVSRLVKRPCELTGSR